MNKCLFTGNVCKDPLISLADSGVLVCKIDVAVEQNFKSKRTGKFETDFLRFTCFDKQANYLHTKIKKGDMVEITAELRNNHGLRPDGSKIYRDDLYLRSIKLLRRSLRARKNEVVEIEDLDVSEFSLLEEGEN